MTYLATESRVRWKPMDLADACPVACFRGREHVLAICPDECIECGIVSRNVPSRPLSRTVTARQRPGWD